MTMRRFYLKRTNDETGISGSGYVLSGAILPSGRVIVEWAGKFASVTIHESIESFRVVHVSPHHPSSNEIVWVDHEQVACVFGYFGAVVTVPWTASMHEAKRTETPDGLAPVKGGTVQ